MDTTVFKDTINKKTELINDILERFLPEEEGYFEIISRPVNYSVRAGGKRLRPLLLLESYLLCGGSEEKTDYIVPFLAGIEYIHTYSLVHDDLPAMDNDMLRRGKPTTHAKFGEDFGILAGDGLLNLAYETMLDAAGKDNTGCAVRAAAVIAKKAGIYGMVGGQSLDVHLTGKAIQPDELDFIFKLKTGALIEAVFAAGAILAGADEETVKVCERIGSHVGMAFQIRDDLLDITGTEEEIGKPVNSDEKNNKTTYVTLFGQEKAEADVYAHTKKALELLEKTGDNKFLCSLIKYMAERKS